MFERFAAIALIVTPVVLAGSALVSAGRRRTGPPAREGGSRWPVGLVLVGVAACGIAALAPVFGGHALRGWWLYAHVLASPVLILGLAALGLRRPRPAKPEVASARGSSENSGLGVRAAGFAAWLVLALGVLTAGSILLNMPAWLGQASMAVLLDVHRYAGVLLCAGAMVLGFRTFIHRH